MDQKHTCRSGGQSGTALSGPAWASPGEIVKLIEAPVWGRIKLHWHCCESYDVQVDPSVDLESTGVVLSADQVPVRGNMLTARSPESLTNPYGRRADRLPSGYPIPPRS